MTNSADFPATSGAFATARSGAIDAFVAKLAPDGGGLTYATYLGGSGSDEQGFAIAVDSAGSAYVGGLTDSADFPWTVGADDTTLGGTRDAFVTKLAADGASLIYSTYVGGSGVEDDYVGIAVESGSAYVTGRTASGDFPTTVGADDTTLGGTHDAYVSKLATDGTDLAYSTYLGASGNYDEGDAIAVDSAGSAYVTGVTDSTDFPNSAGALDTTLGGFDAFVTKLAADGESLAYSTYLGGSGGDQGKGIAVDSAGSAYVTGSVQSSDFPTPGAFDTTLGGGLDAFVSKLAPGGGSLDYSTFLGGGGSDLGLGVAVDSAGSAYVTGLTESADFPTTAGAFDTTRGGSRDAFVSKLTVGAAPPPTQCSDGIDNDGDGAIDYPADPGCSSAADDSESPNPSSIAPQCGDTLDNDGDGAVDLQDPGCASAQDNNEADESLNDLVLCGSRQISLVRADAKGKKVVLSGFVAQNLGGQPVQIFANYGGKKAKGGRLARLTTVKANPDGTFKARVNGPPARLFNKARFLAQVGRARSVALKLPQSLASSSVRQAGQTIELRGAVKRVLLGKRNPVVVKRLVCGHYQTVGSAKPSARGAYVVRFPAPALGAAALYRAESMVLARPGSKRYVKQYARAIGITLTGQTD